MHSQDKMRISHVMMWSLFTTLFIVYLMAIKMVRGSSDQYITGSYHHQPYLSPQNYAHQLQTRAAVHNTGVRSFRGNSGGDTFASSGLLQGPSSAPKTGNKIVDFGYHHYEAMEGLLRQFADSFPQLCQLYSIGKSAQGKFFCCFCCFVSIWCILFEAAGVVVVLFHLFLTLILFFPLACLLFVCH